MKCIYCKEYIVESNIEPHLRTVHRIDHDDGIRLLITLQYSEPLRYLSQELEQTGPAGGEDSESAQPHLDQVPVNESDTSTDIDTANLADRLGMFCIKKPLIFFLQFNFQVIARRQLLSKYRHHS